MTSSPKQGPGPEEPGTSRMPSLGARLADSTPPPRRDRWTDRPDDTGPVPVDPENPLPPPSPPSRPHLRAQGRADLPPPEQPVPPAKGSRAGRNLGAAIGVGVSLGAVIVLSLVLWRPAFLGVLGAAVLVGVVELTRALRAGKFQAPLIPLLVGAVAME